MTLCVAWRDSSDAVHLAADSRVSVSATSFEDVAVKVTRIPCELFPPSSSMAPGQGILRIDVGLAFAGSHMCAYVIKESLVEVLSRLQYVPGETEISMDKIAKIAFLAYSDLSKQVCTMMAEKGICEMFLAGYCEKEQRKRVFRFSTHPTSNKHTSKEILLAPGIELSGTGETRARQSTYFPAKPLRALKEVIDDPKVPSVGGAIQYGTFEVKRFLIYSEYRCEDSRGPTYLRAGLDINALISRAASDDLFVSPLLYDLDLS